MDILKRNDIPENCRKVIMLRQEAGKTSTAKMDTMILAASADGRVRGTLQYHGATTGRWAGRRIQVHNFPRPIFSTEETENILQIVGKYNSSVENKSIYLNMIYGSPMSALASSLRGMICAPKGKEFCVADFANIEGRVLAWLAGEQWKLQAFRDYDTILGYNDNGEPIRKGRDIYLIAAGRTFGKPPEDCKPQRQIGKVEELALGFEGGVGAFEQMAVTYGLKIGEHYETVWAATSESVHVQVLQAWKQRGFRSGIEEYTWKAAEAVKVTWRNAHPKIVQFWSDIKNAAISAVTNPGGIYSAGAKSNPVKFRVNGSFLWCQLPSRRVLCYCYPKIVRKELPWSTLEQPQFADMLTYKGTQAPSYTWQPIDTYGGKLAENVTQAVARDILVYAIVDLEAADFDIIFHVHDEPVAEVENGVDRLEEMCQIMHQVPNWAKGLPIGVKGWQGRRYRK